MSGHLLSHSNSFGFEMEKDAAGCRALNRNFIVGGVFTHDRGYHIHSYNTFFPMWYASALAFYIGDFRYHSRYSHFENTPSGGDFVNETFKIIYQGN